MKFLDFITTEDILFLPGGLDRYGAIRYMVTNAACFASENWTGKADSAARDILKREELGSTGIGRGVACPHTKHPHALDILAVVGISQEGMDFNSLDGEKVCLFFLWVAPVDRPGDHLRYCERVSRQLRDEVFCRFLIEAKSEDEVIQLLGEADNNPFVY